MLPKLNMCQVNIYSAAVSSGANCFVINDIENTNIFMKHTNFETFETLNFKTFESYIKQIW